MFISVGTFRRYVCSFCTCSVFLDFKFQAAIIKQLQLQMFGAVMGYGEADGDVCHGLWRIGRKQAKDVGSFRVQNLQSLFFLNALKTDFVSTMLYIILCTAVMVGWKWNCVYKTLCWVISFFKHISHHNRIHLVSHLTKNKITAISSSEALYMAMLISHTYLMYGSWINHAAWQDEWQL